MTPMAESDASLDAQLELKKRARRRLVGASALALLAAIVLPMVMDHEPRPPAQDIQVRIPSQDGAGPAARILPAKPAATPLPPAVPAAETKPEPKPEAKAEAKPEAKPEPKPEAKPQAEAPKSAAAPAPAKAPEAKPAEKPAEKAVAKAAEKPAEKPAEKVKPTEQKAEESRAANALGGGEQWVVQLGAYKEAGNVKLLLGKIKQMNIPAYTESFESPQGPRTRVRAGPFASKEAAEKAQTKIKIIGVTGPVAPK